MVPELETPRLRLRAATADDAQAIFRYFQNAEAIAYWSEPDRTEQDSLRRIERMQRHWQEHGFGDWALVDKAGGAFVGFCGLHYISGMTEVNLGYFVGRAWWGRGLVSEVAPVCLDYGFQSTSVDLVVGVTHPDNVRSIRILEKCGMTFWKEIDRYGPRRVFSIRKSDWQSTGSAISADQ